MVPARSRSATTAPRQAAIRLHPDDNVAVALSHLPAGTPVSLDGTTITTTEPIPPGHKLAIEALCADDLVRKYGSPIGRASTTIPRGAWVHVHNVSVVRVDADPAALATGQTSWQQTETRTFQGYRRPGGGRAGTRNYIAVISNVNCSASVCKYVARHFTTDRLRDYPHVDGVVAFSHEGGCAIEFASRKHQMLNRVMAGIAKHPNIGGVVMIGLGCEQVTLDYLIEEHELLGRGEPTEAPLHMTIQECGGTSRTVEAGIARVAELLPRVNEARRETIDACELILATECGGSDSYSGFTANPALGAAADRLIRCGGTVILSETPEIAGAEHLLMQRACSVSVAHKLADLIRWWHDYAAQYGQTLDHNPSQGNREGGLTTITEKSLGAVAKAGSAPLTDVLDYATHVAPPGLVVMDSPGFDPASVTGMVAGGAQLVTFTTGRGSCFGCKPSPSLKVCSNSHTYHRLSDDMDVDAGRIAAGTATVSEVGDEIFEQLLRVASGEPTKSERLGIGDEEFVPWTVGPTL